MELYTLRPDFQLDKLVENYSSLIWTERYATNGDFEIVTPDIQAMMNLLPLEVNDPSGLHNVPPTCLGLRDSNVPMIVEMHQIEKSATGAPLLKITGRSYETVMERRGSVNKPVPFTVGGGVTAREEWYIPALKESDAAYKAMRMVVGDVARYQGLVEVLPVQAPFMTPDAFSEIDLTLPSDFENPVPWDPEDLYVVGSVVSYGGKFWKALIANSSHAPTADTYWQSIGYAIEAGQLYPVVLNLINANHHGLKSVRPTPLHPTGKIGIEVYNGVNRYDNADPEYNVVFDAKFDQFDSATYLISPQGATNVAYIYGPSGGESVLKTSAAEPSGMNRRVLIMDQTNDETASTVDGRKSRAIIELYKYNATAMFDGQVSDQVAAGFNSEYFLGDILKLNGEYGLSYAARVTEFIRISDNTGDQAYPTLERVDT